MSKFCEIVFKYEVLGQKNGQKAREYLKAIEMAVAEFNEDFRVIAGSNEGYYVSRIDGKVEPLNHAHVFGAVLVMLYNLTGKQEYKTMNEQLAYFFYLALERKKMVPTYGVIDQLLRTEKILVLGQHAKGELQSFSQLLNKNMELYLMKMI